MRKKNKSKLWCNFFPIFLIIFLKTLSQKKRIINVLCSKCLLYVPQNLNIYEIKFLHLDFIWIKLYILIKLINETFYFLFFCEILLFESVYSAFIKIKEVSNLFTSKSVIIYNCIKVFRIYHFHLIVILFIFFQTEFLFSPL
jgi:hypothetical protein